MHFTCDFFEVQLKYFESKFIQFLTCVSETSYNFAVNIFLKWVVENNLFKQTMQTVQWIPNIETKTVSNERLTNLDLSKIQSRVGVLS